MSTIRPDVSVSVSSPLFPKPSASRLSHPFPLPEVSTRTDLITHITYTPRTHQVTILPGDWKQLVLRLCLFHAMLTERLQYRSLGWRRPYEFTAADMLSAINQVMSIVHDQPNADLDASLPGLLHVVGQCLYGGKVTHDWDRRLLVCLLSQQLQPTPAAAAANLER